MLHPSKRYLHPGGCCRWRSLPLRGQQAPPSAPPRHQDDTGAIFRSDTRLVVCHTTVVDKNGHLVTNLPQRRLHGLRERTSQQPIKIVQARGRAGFAGPDHRQQRQHAGQARQGGGRGPGAGEGTPIREDEVFVVNFNDEAFLDNPHGKDFTSDIKEMEEALDAHRFARRHRHARRHPHVDRPPEGEGAQGQEGAGGGHGRQRQRAA